uniref:(northern house mosquito) hypothetical protein n=1 Tax=Culex pipiens TaxID=7175 RepID=A0A8D8BNX8_CULPI
MFDTGTGYTKQAGAGAAQGRGTRGRVGNHPDQGKASRPGVAAKESARRGFGSRGPVQGSRRAETCEAARNEVSIAEQTEAKGELERSGAGRSDRRLTFSEQPEDGHGNERWKGVRRRRSNGGSKVRLGEFT